MEEWTKIAVRVCNAPEILERCRKMADSIPPEIMTVSFRADSEGTVFVIGCLTKLHVSWWAGFASALITSA